MNPILQRFRGVARGSSLVVVMVIVAVLSMVCASVMETVTQEFMLSRSTSTWSQALFTAETGVEVGWNEVNKLTGINTNGVFMSGWTYLGTNTWSLTNQTLIPLLGAGGNSVYSVTVATNSPAGSMTITASGVTTLARTGKAITRRVEVILSPNTPFKWGMLGKGLIDFNGNACYMDSFNSATGPWTTGTRRAHGNIGTNGQLIDAAGLDIYGSAQTGPGGVITTASGFNQYQPVSPDTGVNTLSDGLRVNIPDVQLPSGLASATSLGSLNHAYTLNVSGNANYQTSIIDMNGGDVLTISGSGKVRIYVNGPVTVNGNGKILLSPSSPGSLNVEFYVAGTITLNGNGVVNPGKPANLLIYGLPSCTATEINGTADFMGAIYAPSSAFQLNGGARVDGAIVGKTIAAGGTVDFHYDEALANVGVVNYFALTRWREL